MLMSEMLISLNNSTLRDHLVGLIRYGPGPRLIQQLVEGLHTYPLDKNSHKTWNIQYLREAILIIASLIITISPVRTS